MERAEPRLIAISGPCKGNVWALTGEEFTIGRDAKCDHAVMAGADEIAHLPGYHSSRGNAGKSEKGADEIAHLPGYHSPTYIKPEDAKLAAEKGIVVVTTASLALRRKQESELYENIRTAQIANLELLQKSGVKIAIGSDDFQQTSLGEIGYLKDLGMFDNRTLIKTWTENTVKTIFPSRKVGALREDYEASFLALEGNPLKDFENIRKIRFRLKQGYLFER